MSFVVVRRSAYSRHERIVEVCETREEAELAREVWDAQALEDFRVGRIVYDLPEFEVEEARGRSC